MGSCLCKEKVRDGSPSVTCPSPATCTVADTQNTNPRADSSRTVVKRPRVMEPEPVHQLILEMLHYIGTCQDSENVPAPLLKINQMADSDEGWCLVIMELVRAIPLVDPLGPSAITIVFDDCPLPSRDTVLRFTRGLNLNKDRCKEAYKTVDTICQERNLLVLLGSIAEKFAGPNSVQILTEQVLTYLITFLTDERDPHLVLHALVALEKFGRTTQNKVAIEQKFTQYFLHPLLPLEVHHNSKVYLWRQVGFCARWALDNIFLFPGRSFGFETVNMDDIHAILNSQDVSEYLKISPDGLEARSDSHSFESVRGTFQIDSGCWYYEVEVITAGVMQIGWATKKASFQNHDGFGVGDDIFSIAYDGSRRLIWFKAEATPVTEVNSWQPGDILGCLIDVSRREAIFSLNGQRLSVCSGIFSSASEGFFAAASFMAHQQCLCNFGSKNFVFPPQDRQYRVMNKDGNLNSDAKRIIPRWLVRQEMEQAEPPVNQTCIICYNENGEYAVDPCKHGFFCQACTETLENCPLCRVTVREFYLLPL